MASFACDQKGGGRSPPGGSYILGLAQFQTLKCIVQLEMDVMCATFTAFPVGVELLPIQ